MTFYFSRTNRLRRGTDSNIDSDDLSLVSHNIESTLGDLNNATAAAAAAARRPSWRRKRSQRLSDDANNGDAQPQKRREGGMGGGMTLQRYRSSLKRWSLSRTPATSAATDGHDDERQRLPTVKVTGASGDRDAESDGNPVAVGNSAREPSSNGTTAEPEDAKRAEGRHSRPSVEETAFSGENDRDKHGAVPGGPDGAPPDVEVAAAAAAADVVVAENNGDARATPAAADPSLLMVSSSRAPSASFRLRRRRVQVRDNYSSNRRQRNVGVGSMDGRFYALKSANILPRRVAS